MGVAYSAERQKHLENAFEISREGNVNAKIVPETDNAYDKDAISVMLDYGHEWSKIGYIAKELTQFLHPLLKQDLITNVSLKHINFRTSYLKVGFYATIQITRKGQWENAVLKVSKRVTSICEDISFHLEVFETLELKKVYFRNSTGSITILKI